MGQGWQEIRSRENWGLKNNLKIVVILFGGYGGYQYLCAS
jgi:hypothetical protein